MSNDVNRIDNAIIFGHFIWILPIQSAIVVYLIWQQARWVAIISVTFILLLTFPINILKGYYSSFFRKRVALLTDQRIKMINEIIEGIQVIKMFGWEIPFRKMVSEIRHKEIQQIRYASYVTGIALCAINIVARTTLFVSILACVITKQRISSDIIFSMAQYFAMLDVSC